MATVSQRTVKQLINKALEKILVQSDQQPAQVIELESAFESFQEWIDLIKADGLNIGITPASIDDTVGSLNFPDGTYQGLVFNFAVVLATEYDRVITPSLINNAEDGMRVIEKILVSIQPTAYGPRVPIGSGNSGDDDFTEDYYRARQAVTPYGDSIIEVTAGGGSGGGGGGSNNFVTSFNNRVGDVVPAADDYSASDISGLQVLLDAKQQELVSGQNISTVNGQSLLQGSDVQIPVGTITGANVVLEVADNVVVTPRQQVQGATYSGTGFPRGAAGSLRGISSRDGNILIVDLAGVVHDFGTTGTYVGIVFTAAAQVTAAAGLDWDGTYFWVSDTTTNRVYRYDSAGVYTNLSVNLTVAGRGLATSGVSLYAADQAAGSFRVYNKSTTAVSQISLAPTNTAPRGVAEIDGDLWVSSQTNAMCIDLAMLEFIGGFRFHCLRSLLLQLACILLTVCFGLSIQTMHICLTLLWVWRLARPLPLITWVFWQRWGQRLLLAMEPRAAL